MTVKEFRGCKNLVYAVIATDTEDPSTGEFVTGEVKSLAPVAEISKTVETSNEAHYYDNKAAIVINSEGEDTVTFTIAIPDDETLAEITGRTFEKGLFIESVRKQRYFAVGYILGENGGDGKDERYVWRLKGTFNIPDETSATEDDGTSANNMSLEFTGIYTNHIFKHGRGLDIEGVAKAVYTRASGPSMTADEWFAKVQTPDTVLGG